MGAKNPRVNTLLEEPVFEVVRLLAQKESVSLSQNVRDLVREALELIEDEGLEALVEARRRGAPPVKWVPHAEVKRRLRIS